MGDNAAIPRDEEAASMEEDGEECQDDTKEEYRDKETDHKSDVIKVQNEMLDKLGLTSFFPEKISLKTAMENSSGKRESLADVPWYFITKMFMLDYRGRDDIISETIRKKLNSHNTQSQDEGSLDDYDRLFEELNGDFPSCNSCFSAPNPLDHLIAVFRCSSYFVRQILFEKMFICKLSIPIILPPFQDQESMFLLWPLRNIILKFEDSNGELHESSVATIPTSVVSCVRLGEISRSKSKFLNDILNSNSHPTFMHRDCKNGMNTRFFSDGLIELAWLLPSKKSENPDQLDEKVSLLNLRGDGMTQETSRKFMCQVSNVILVIVDIVTLEKQDVINTLKSIASNEAELVLLLTKQSNVKLSEQNKTCLKNCMESVKCDNLKMDGIVFDFKGNVEKNIEDLKEETIKKLRVRSKKMTPRSIFQSFEVAAKMLHVIVDENTPECSVANERASELMQKIHERGTNNLKTTMLPLQCTPLRKWAKLNKEEHRRDKNCGDDILGHMDRISESKTERRKEQMRLLKESHTLLDIFWGHLLKSKSDEKLYYLKWLKLYLDDITRKTLPGIQIECSMKWNEIRTFESRQVELSKLPYLRSELVTLEQKLADSSFGLEHFIREMSQAYEAVESLEEIGSEDHIRTSDLPRIMAELMLLGYPLELMDGDAAHVPLLWIKAVLEQLRELVGDKKIFILSVLGIQSSGKSTMLNTMFGLQFAVAAGKCTRGVYAQLLPICKEYSSKKYDYILVVDTEGLKATDLGSNKFQHDNEIATLVIGLGDVTLVTIKGENVSEMEDVLHIVIHALLKMRLVNKDLTLQPACFFIHQNVPAPDAAQLLRSGQQNFIETLDRVTKVAGKQEDAPQFTKFSQLIDFDIDTHISYFSDLWKGDPPMGPANPGYSENVETVKQTLLTDIMEKRASLLTISRFSTKLKHLWNGILDQNFVFSFKNFLEMEAYSLLDDKLSDILWSMKKAALEWQSHKENEIESSESGIEDLRNNLTNECCSHLSQTYSVAEAKVNNIFETHEDHSIVEQWRSRTCQVLNNCYNAIISNTIEVINLKLKARQIQIDQRNDMEMYQANLMEEAQNVAETMRLKENSKNLDDEELLYYFNEIWEEWITKLPQNPQDHINIMDRVNKVLYEKFPQDYAVVKKALVGLEIEDVNTICRNFEYATDKYISKMYMTCFFNKVVKKSHSEFNREVFSRIREFLPEVQRRIVNEFRENLFTDIRDFVMDARYPGFKSEYAGTIIQKAKELIRKMIDSELDINDEEEFTICIAIITCQYAFYIYSSKCKLDTAIDGNFKFGKFGIHPYFEQELFRMFPCKLVPVLLESTQRNFNKFMISIEEHVTFSVEMDKLYVERHAANVVIGLCEDIQYYIEKQEIQDFREEHVEEILKMVAVKVDKDTSVVFKKNFKIQLAVHICYLILPKFCEKHKRYIDNCNPRKVLERDYYRTYYQMFKNSYKKIANETALSMLLCERLNKAIEKAVDKAIPRVLADAVRENVAETRSKQAFVEAVLLKLLEEDQFVSFYLYLHDTKACFELWISNFIDNYLFPEEGSNRYSEIATKMIANLLSKVCKEISGPILSISENLSGREALREWIKLFQRQITEKLPIPLTDLLSLANEYDILNLESFTKKLEESLKASQEKITDIFNNHTVSHLIYEHEESVYKLVYQECIGCTEKCPFCSAPCILNRYDHIEDGIKHMAKEHYPQACGGVRWARRFWWISSPKSIIENCTTLVATGKMTFRCEKTNNQPQLYRKYHEIYPDWKIDGDLSVEASPYWKWFLVKYESQLAKIHEANRPDIPNSWRGISKRHARESVKRFICS